MSGPVYFCRTTNVRITGPGVCKDVDPVNGHDVWTEPPSAPVVTLPADEPAPSKGEPQTLETSDVGTVESVLGAPPAKADAKNDRRVPRRAPKSDE